MKKIILLLLLLNSIIFAGKINIAVAANVSFVIEDLIKEFNKTNPDTKILVTLGSSGKLTAQIKHGAPYEIFMSANMKYPEALYSEKIATSKPVVYVKGGLAILSSKKYDFTHGINILKNNSISKIAVANPKTAPYGVATIEALKNANIYDELKPKFVYGESISQTVSFTLIAADIGIIAKSALYDKKMSKFKENENWISINSNIYTPISQGIVILNNAQEKDEVKAFYDFILSQKSKMIFKNFGYEVE